MYTSDLSQVRRKHVSQSFVRPSLIQFPCLYPRDLNRCWLLGARGQSWKCGHLIPPSTVSEESHGTSALVVALILGCKTTASEVFPVLGSSSKISSAVGTVRTQLLLPPSLTPLPSSNLSKKQRAVPSSCPINAHTAADVAQKETQVGKGKFTKALVRGKENRRSPACFL